MGWAEDAGCMAGAGPGFICTTLSEKQNENFKLNEQQQDPKLLYKYSLMCSWHLCSDK